MGCASSKPASKNADDVKLISTENERPNPRLVIKTSRMKSNQKLFINLCEVNWTEQDCMRVSRLKLDKDKKGDSCECVDVLVHPSVFHGYLSEVSEVNSIKLCSLFPVPLLPYNTNIYDENFTQNTLNQPNLSIY